MLYDIFEVSVFKAFPQIFCFQFNTLWTTPNSQVLGLILYQCGRSGGRTSLPLIMLNCSSRFFDYRLLWDSLKGGKVGKLQLTIP